MSLSFKEGWMTKQGGLIKTWKRRYFVLTANSLIYYSKPGSKEKGRINIQDATPETAPDCKRQPAFKLNTPDRVFYIVTDNPNDTQDWISTIRYIKSRDA